MRATLACALLTAAAVLATSADTAAEPILQPSVAGQVVIADSAVAAGGTATLLAGYNTENDPILIVPHVAVAGGYYGGDFSGGLFRGLAGMKFGVSLSVEPSLITRGGYGFYQLGVAGAETLVHGAAFQSGPALDYRVDRDISLGGTLLYDLFIDADTGNTVHAVLLGFSVGFGL